MKKLIFFFLLPLLLLSSCYFWSEIDYELINNTNYDVVIVDNDVNKTEYNLKANSKTTISHTNSARFSLKTNTYPVFIKNNHTYTSVENLPSFKLNVINKTSDTYTLKQSNKTYGTGFFIIPSNFQGVIELYTNSQPVFNLYKNEENYLNFVLNNNYLYIN